MTGSVFEWDNVKATDFNLSDASDTNTCITGVSTAAYYCGVPDNIRAFVTGNLPDAFVALPGRFEEVHGGAFTGVR